MDEMKHSFYSHYHQERYEYYYETHKIKFFRDFFV